MTNGRTKKRETMTNLETLETTPWSCLASKDRVTANLIQRARNYGYAHGLEAIEKTLTDDLKGRSTTYHVRFKKYTKHKG